MKPQLKKKPKMFKSELLDERTFSHQNPHRDRLVLLALLRQIPDAVDEEFVGADVRLPGFNHATA